MHYSLRTFVVVLLLAGFTHKSNAQENPVSITAAFPGGNIAVDSVRGNTVYIRPDLRDTGQDWFYWYFAAIPAKTDSITFRFPRSNCMTVSGPAVSTDKGKTWEWLDPGNALPDRFTYFGRAGEEVRFSMGMPYTQENFDRFFRPFRKHPSVKVESLCTTSKGRKTEKILIGRPGKTAARHKILITARHHACEMMASYVLEGIIETLLSQERNVVSLREDTEFMIIPFIDKDGVEDGDQGKARTPRDHNRDYNGESIYCSTGTLRSMIPGWSGGDLKVAMDLHCPWIKGDLNEHIYLVGNSNETIAKQETEFMKYLTVNNHGEVKYDPEKGIVPFGTAWNTDKNYSQGTSFDKWASGLEGIRLATTFEIPYSVNGTQLLNPDNLRDFGKDVAVSILQYLSGDSE
jgi:hypothetical protein